MLNTRAANASVKQWRLWAVATSIWMVDGRSMLGHDAAVPFMRDFLRGVPPKSMGTLFSILLGLFARVSHGMQDIEKYCLETHSRYLWKTTGKELVVGVPGATSLGLNAVQQVWFAYNEMEDLHRQEDTAWEGFKLVASSNAPKAMKKVDARDTTRRQEQEEQRLKKLDLLYYSKLGVVDAEGHSIGDGLDLAIRGPKTVGDLEDEMRRWVTGDQDLHDQVVADYKANVIAKQEQERREREARRAALQAERERIEEVGVAQPSQLIGLTLEELQYVLRERGAGRPGVSKVHTGPPMGVKEHVYARYLEYGEDGGELQVKDGKLHDPQARPDMDQRTLNELIKSRNPAFRPGE